MIVLKLWASLKTSKQMNCTKQIFLPLSLIQELLRERLNSNNSLLMLKLKLRSCKWLRVLLLHLLQVLVLVELHHLLEALLLLALQCLHL